MLTSQLFAVIMKGVQIKLTRKPFMLATDKARIMVYLDPNTDEKLREVVFKHRKTVNISTLAEAMILHCLSDKKFLNSLKKEEIDY